MRPRDVLRFVRGSIEVAVNRGHDRVTEADVEQAEHAYSEDAFVDVTLELKDVNSKYSDVPYAFIGTAATLSRNEIETRLKDAGVSPGDFERVVDLLLWFGFLGIYVSADEERYSYQFQHDLKKMHSGLKQHAYSIHPSFRSTLGCAGN